MRSIPGIRGRIHRHKSEFCKEVANHRDLHTHTHQTQATFCNNLEFSPSHSESWITLDFTKSTSAMGWSKECPALQQNVSPSKWTLILYKSYLKDQCYKFRSVDLREYYHCQLPFLKSLSLPSPFYFSTFLPCKDQFRQKLEPQYTSTKAPWV